MELVLATANPDKAREVRTLLEGELGRYVVLVDRPGDVADVEESGSTLEENARLKAQAICDATGLAAVADDTGLEVEALGGAPGVLSARFAGPDATYDDNVSKLLLELERVGARSPHERRARFRTVALARFPDGFELRAEGEVQGAIALERRGSNGFGYDVVFVPSEGDGRSFGEMAPAEKNAMSHRGRAFRELARLLQRHVGQLPS